MLACISFLIFNRIMKHSYECSIQTNRMSILQLLFANSNHAAVEVLISLIAFALPNIKRIICVYKGNAFARKNSIHLKFDAFSSEKINMNFWN